MVGGESACAQCFAFPVTKKATWKWSKTDMPKERLKLGLPLSQINDVRLYLALDDLLEPYQSQFGVEFGF